MEQEQEEIFIFCVSQSAAALQQEEKVGACSVGLPMTVEVCDNLCQRCSAVADVEDESLPLFR